MNICNLKIDTSWENMVQVFWYHRLFTLRNVASVAISQIATRGHLPGCKTELCLWRCLWENDHTFVLFVISVKFFLKSMATSISCVYDCSTLKVYSPLILDGSELHLFLHLTLLLLSSRQRCPLLTKSHRPACLRSCRLRFQLHCRLPWRLPWLWMPRRILPLCWTSGKKRSGVSQTDWCPSWPSQTLSFCLSVPLHACLRLDGVSPLCLLQNIWADWTGDRRILQSRPRSVWWPSSRWLSVYTLRNF